MGLAARLLGFGLNVAAGAGEGYLEHQKRLEEIRRARFQMGQESARTELEGRRTAADERRSIATERQSAADIDRLSAMTLTEKLRAAGQQQQNDAYGRLTPEEQTGLKRVPLTQAEASRTRAEADRMQQQRLGAETPPKGPPVPEWMKFVSTHPRDYIAILDEAARLSPNNEVFNSADFTRWMERKDVSAFFAKYSALKAEEAAMGGEDDLGGEGGGGADLGGMVMSSKPIAPRAVAAQGDLGGAYSAQATPAMSTTPAAPAAPSAPTMPALQAGRGSIGPQTRQAISVLIQRGRARNEQEALALLEGANADLSQ